MFPFTYYIDCRGDLWVPCHCGRGDSGEGRIEGAAAGRERAEARRDRDLEREGERICRASKTEEAVIHREMTLDKTMDEILAAVKRLERLHEAELEGLAPGA